MMTLEVGDLLLKSMSLKRPWFWLTRWKDVFGLLNIFDWASGSLKMAGILQFDIAKLRRGAEGRLFQVRK